ncbi:hypothetical protein, partial [Paracoccus spongiarum]
MSAAHSMPSPNAVSFDALLDLFEAYVATVGVPLQDAVNLIRDELDYHQGEIFLKILTPVHDAEQMAQQLRVIRARRQASGVVRLELSRSDARITRTHARDLQELVG